MKFVNRIEELTYVQQAIQSKKNECILVYGKRRVGKTSLLLEILKKQEGFYYMAQRLPRVQQLAQFSQQAGAYLKDTFIAERGFSSWKQAFERLLKEGKTITVVLDEFPYLVESDKNIAIEFQYILDHLFHSRATTTGQGKIKLIVAGSSMSMMQRLALEYQSPLYGRKTGILHVLPMSYQPLKEYFGVKKFDDLLNIYSLCGGIPLYWEQYDRKKSFWENVAAMTLTKNALLKDEVEFLIQEELREPAIYFSLLSSIAFGAHKLSEIIARSGLQKGTITQYLSNLQRLHFIRREVPFGHHPEKSKSGLYFLEEHFIQFWFRYIFPHRDVLAEGRVAEMVKLIQKDFSLFQSGVYEQMIKTILQSQEDTLGFRLMGARRFWSKDVEIDMVGVDDERGIISFVEAKHSRKLVGSAVLHHLQEQSQFVGYLSAKNYAQKFILCSTSGFTRELIDNAKRDKQIVLVRGDKILMV
ncbi:MAG: AAA family ATPase [Candidatus Kerfeldbacteria bacterium]|nr:AAA family ATPase [Candidatus Kerfeldbacteria bacterium]